MKTEYVAPTVAIYTVELEQFIAQSHAPTIKYSDVQYTDYGDGGEINQDVLIF
jgi:hypothetical protein